MADEDMQDQELQEEELQEHSAELLEEAKNLGWVPKDQFKGNPEKWTDAPEFVENGQKITPILRANNKRLQKDLLQTRTELGNMKAKLESTESAVSQLVKANAEAVKATLEARKAALKEELKDARQENDVDRELEVQEHLRNIEDKLKEKPTTPAPKTEPTKSNLSPEFIEWQKENPWYGGTSPEDKKRTKLAGRIAEDLREEGVDLTGRDFLELVKEKLEEQEEASSGNPRSNSKVEGINPHRRTRSGAKTWADLPAEAKLSCSQFDDQVVGPNKMYKTQAEWRAQYAKDYFSEEG